MTTKACTHSVWQSSNAKSNLSAGNPTLGTLNATRPLRIVKLHHSRPNKVEAAAIAPRMTAKMPASPAQ